ncbi:hypothetical protein M405DRAFT_854392 [Rhizopogon salebrosus TDB-379]|nr:hypothetical protein M405DRAFT_854392 [Rhizopogon salebrosus TDB-379]
MMTEANITRLVSKLSQMRVAVLGLCRQNLPPRPGQRTLHDRLANATTSLGETWADNFISFDRIPSAAASIASGGGSGQRVAVKIQFPNIANSIANASLIAGSLLLLGVFLDRTIQVYYSRKASFLKRYGAPECFGEDARFKVPWVWPGSTERVLVMVHVEGVSIGDAVIGVLPQEERNEIASRIIELSLRELFQFRLIQTDPNFTNFPWNSRSQQLSLVDFGAMRECKKEFMDNWLRFLRAAASEDRIACAEVSRSLWYLTGEENERPLSLRLHSLIAFELGTPWADIAARIRDNIPVMLKHRFTPPPRETYSLNRKLSGASLLASRLWDLFLEIERTWASRIR